MKNSFMIVLVSALSSAFSVSTFAGDNHNHEAAVEPAPKGGILRDTTFVKPKKEDGKATKKDAAAATESAGATTATGASPYKSELVLNKDTAQVYIYTKQGKDLVPAKLEAKELKGYVRFPKDTKDKPVVFKKSGDPKSGEFYVATIPGISKIHRFDMHANLEEKGQVVLLDFGIDNIH